MNKKAKAEAVKHTKMPVYRWKIVTLPNGRFRLYCDSAVQKALGTYFVSESGFTTKKEARDWAHENLTLINEPKKEELKAVTHTPTLWSIGEQGAILGGQDPHHQVIVAQTYAKGDAALIVRAVNSHEALLSAALKVQLRLQKLQGHIDPELERAIAQAEVK